MPLWKQLLLSLYYDATCPLRAWNRRRWALQGRLPAIVLFWHRIADDRANAWTTSNALFAGRFVGCKSDLRLFRWKKPSGESAKAATASRASASPSTTVTPTIAGRPSPGSSRNESLAPTSSPCKTFSAGEPFPDDLAMGRRLAPNNLEQLRAMAAAGIEIGAHTFTHANLGAIGDPRLLHREVVSAREELQKALGRPIRYFAFPYGLHANLSRAAFALSEAAGYSGVCSAYGGFNFPGDDPFHLQRIPADAPMICMKNWVTLDPRKLRIPRFEYRTPAAGDSCETASGQFPCEAASGS